MAFFGLTALGPQNSFAAVLKDSILVDIFSDEEFESAFNRVAVNGCLSGEAELVEVLEKVYHGEVPAAELQMFIDATAVAEDGTITRAAFDDTVASMRAKATEFMTNQHQVLSGACETSSSEVMQTNLRRHTRSKAGPTDKYSQPLVTSQEYGWSQTGEDLKTKRAAKMSCKETQYAAELIKCGVYF
mmetsp:Transcript_5658/g.9608  ORF Transcript_5658/g.9608 Transcript_5658/m.9608 type:complete len:187 (+) Transcript_5658:87-647(+)|eukprot:CAMPEP_0205907462 /NCGR_PEP_ID=MMETSP1325-20131115/2570_1 /ASSEMBLY_ACC=CAM_ASM_000708 /TAXON_ID=236786 /ORGANISM="Florenciella sp., Strain RCC1007" /LENGTH=186 /DNA_ID=CAMNT_0053273557 /DNA_START=87 /DNA_END=647 /DNA_ORIENTATION=+